MSSPPQSDPEAYLGPLPIFDHNLKLLEESYIQFFQERVRIEEFYVESLRRLHLKHRALDTHRDDRSARGASVRRAWREVSDNAERETDTREAFLSNLKSEILAPLTALKETQERTRNRIKEDLKNAIIAHMEYADNVLPRFKRNYVKKCQEVEDYKSGKHVPVSPPPPPQQADPLMKITSNPIGSPLPMRPPTRHPSTHQQGGGRNRSPSSSTAFLDLAHQGKKQLNSLMTFLNEGGKNGPTKELLGGGRSESALRGVRAKREADEADKEYRKGVHWLETLRLHRVKTLESGYKSLELFVLESAETMKKVLERYSDSLIATSTTITQLTSHIEPIIRAISPSQDATIITAAIPRAMARDIPKPVLYYNYAVGQCRDLIFGVALVDYATAHNIPEGIVPKVVEICVCEVEARGMDTEGIYRISGRHANVQELKYKIERDERSFRFNPTVDDISSVASMLKLYLRELPEPLFRFPLSERLQHTDEREDHVANNFPVLRSKLRRLPSVHQATLRCVVEHLSRVASRSQFNKMDAKNLAIVFGSVIFGEEELPRGGDILSMQNWKDTVMEDLITHAPLLFDDRPTLHEPPLPPAPSGEPKPKYDYGSSYTQVTTLPPRYHDDQDFTPSLPPRPGQSIHPSRRSNQQPPRDLDGKEEVATSSSPVGPSYTSQSDLTDEEFTGSVHPSEVEKIPESTNNVADVTTTTMAEVENGKIAEKILEPPMAPADTSDTAVASSPHTPQTLKLATAIDLSSRSVISPQLIHRQEG